MLLTIDLGNTCLSMGLFKNGKIERQSKMEYSKNINVQALTMVLESVFGNINIDECIISSVVNDLTEAIQDAVYQTFKVKALILTNDFDIGVKLQVKHPETIGSDRLANLCGAATMYKKRPLVIVDCGSATTFDILDKNGDFIGGIIMPGFGMQLKALHDNTSKLPEIKLDTPFTIDNIIGTNTESQLLSGVIMGHICSIEGLLDKCTEELGSKPFVILTGGGAEIIKNMSEDKYDIIDTMLTLKGLYYIYELNKD